MKYFFDRALYYFSIIFPIVFYVLLFGYFFLNNDVSLLSDWHEKLLYYSKFFWYTGILVVIANLFGFLFYGSPLARDDQNIAELRQKGWNKKKRLIVTYVSRGDNYEALERSLQNSASVLEALKVDYMIDVVTDHPVSHKMENFLHTHFHVVHEDYQTEQNTKYKARALHYLVEQRLKPEHHSFSHPDVWILHLDEESSVTPSVIAGINKFISAPVNAQKIGQGEIKYNSYRYGDSTLITVADAIRTGDDLGRFRFQYKTFGRPLFGMHGSFIVIPADIENKLGFNLGIKQSITEDAYFAFKAVDQGYKFGWVDGHIREQSPFTIKALILQRRRWFVGLNYLAFDNEISFKARFILIINMLLWFVAWLGPVVTVINLAVGGGYLPTNLAILAASLQGGYAAIYLIGVQRNLIDLKLSWLRKVYIYVATFILIPIVNVFEGLAVLYALVKPLKGFDVVNKN